MLVDVSDTVCGRSGGVRLGVDISEHFGFAPLVANQFAPRLYSCRRVHESEPQRQPSDDFIIERIDSGPHFGHRPALIRAGHAPHTYRVGTSSQRRSIAQRLISLRREPSADGRKSSFKDASQ